MVLSMADARELLQAPRSYLPVNVFRCVGTPLRSVPPSTVDLTGVNSGRNAILENRQLIDVSKHMSEVLQPPDVRPVADPTGRIAEFEKIYRVHVGTVMSYFARRTEDPQLTADLTADTFVAAITSFDMFDSAKGSPRAWLFGIARHVFAQHCESVTRGRTAVARLGGYRVIDIDEAAELLDRIDAERPSRDLLDGLAALSTAEREVVDLVDLAGLTPKEAATALGLSPGALRVRLFRVRHKLRTLTENNENNEKGTTND
jgi:RNA polymerase sigma factor (sigma-70 family)